MNQLIPTTPQLFCVLIALAFSCGTALAKPPAEWTFDRAGELQGWTAANNLSPAVVTNGALTAVSNDDDPFFVLSGLEVPAAK